MAVSSMTGFARAAGSSGGWRWTVELKSVNAKGLDLRLKGCPRRSTGSRRGASVRRQRSPGSRYLLRHPNRPPREHGERSPHRSYVLANGVQGDRASLEDDGSMPCRILRQTGPEPKRAVDYSPPIALERAANTGMPERAVEATARSALSILSDASLSAGDMASGSTMLSSKTLAGDSRTEPRSLSTARMFSFRRARRRANQMARFSSQGASKPGHTG